MNSKRRISTYNSAAKSRGILEKVPGELSVGRWVRSFDCTKNRVVVHALEVCCRLQKTIELKKEFS